MANLFELYGGESEQSPENAVNLMEVYGDGASQLSPQEIARRRIDQQHPNMPGWLKNFLLSASSDKPNPALEAAGTAAGKFNQAVEGAGFPSISRGLLSGLTAPVRFGANAANYASQMMGNEPSEFLSKAGQPLPGAPAGVAPSVPFTGISIPVAPTAELGGEVLGSIYSGGPLFQTLMRGSKAARIPKVISKPLSGMVTGAALSPEQPVTGAAVGAAAPAATKVAKMALEDLPSVFRVLQKEQKPLEAFNKMRNAYDKIDTQASNLYKISDEIAAAKELQPIKIEKSALDLAKKHLNPDKKYLELLDKSRKGDYKAIHKVQSDMGKRFAKIKANPNSTNADNDIAENLRKARDKINNQLQSGILQQGHADLAAVRKQANDLYRQKMQTYHNEKLSPSARKVFMKGVRLQPGQNDMSLMKPFMERSEAMEALLAAHPEMKAEVELARAKQQAMAQLNPFMKTAKATGMGGGLIKIGELLSNLL